MGDNGSGVDELLNGLDGGGSVGELLLNVHAELVVLGALAFGGGGDEGESLSLNKSYLDGDLLVLLGDSGSGITQFLVLSDDLASESIDLLKWCLNSIKSYRGGGLLAIPGGLGVIHCLLGGGNGSGEALELKFEVRDLLLPSVGSICDLVILGLLLGGEVGNGTLETVLHVGQDFGDSGDLIGVGGEGGGGCVVSGLGGGLGLNSLVISDIGDLSVSSNLLAFLGVHCAL